MSRHSLTPRRGDGQTPIVSELDEPEVRPLAAGADLLRRLGVLFVVTFAFAMIAVIVVNTPP